MELPIPYHKIVDTEDKIIPVVHDPHNERRIEPVNDTEEVPFSSYLHVSFVLVKRRPPDGFQALIIILLSYGEFLILLITSAS